MAIIIAIFIAMVAFTTSAIIATREQQNLQVTRLGSKNVQRRTAVRGAANHLLSMLRRGEGENYTKTSPLILDIGEVKSIEVWSFLDPNHPDVRHVQAANGGILSSTALGIVAPRSSEVFIKQNQSLYSREANELAWSPVPAPPQIVYDASGASLSLPNIHLGDILSNDDGKLVVETISATLNRSAIHIWDSETQSWSTVPPLPSFSFTNGQVQVGTSFQPANVTGLDDDKIYTLVSDGLATFDLENQTWDFQSLVVPHRSQGQVSHGADEGLFWVGESDPQTGQAWLTTVEDGVRSQLPVPDEYLAPVGKLDDVLYASLGEDTLKWTGGSWVTVPTPAELDGYRLEDIDAEGKFVYSKPGSLARWTLGGAQLAEEYSTPGGAGSFVPARSIAGGGSKIPGASPLLEVVTSY